MKDMIGRLKLWWSGPAGAPVSLTYVGKDGARHVVYEKVKTITLLEALGFGPRG